MRLILAACAVAAALSGCGRKAAAPEPGQQTPEQLADLKRRAEARSPMIRIPGGCFTMGTDTPPPAPSDTAGAAAGLCVPGPGGNGEVCYQPYDDEKPAHEVCVDPFEIDEHEVTIGAYRLCTENLACEPVDIHIDADYEGDNRPAAGVDWVSADAFCRWLGRRLPTEAEWEFAARGTDGRTYPWGEEPPSCERLAMHLGGEGVELSCGRPGTKNVGSFPADRTPQGVVDLAGNVREWVADRYHPGYYETLAGTRTLNPVGPSRYLEVTVDRLPDSERFLTQTDKSRVLRGGSFLLDEPLTAFRTTNRRGLDEAPRTMPSLLAVGFRCARGEGPSHAPAETGDAGAAEPEPAVPVEEDASAAEPAADPAAPDA